MRKVARGFLSGVIAGTVVTGIGLGAVSIVSGIPGDRRPEATELEVPPGSEFDHSREDRAADPPEEREAPNAGQGPRLAAPDIDDLSSLQEADTAPSVKPQPGEAEGTLDGPESDDGEGGVTVDGENPVLPSPQSQAPETPRGEEDLSISTEPAQPSMPEIDEDGAAFQDEGAPDPGQDEVPERADAATPPDTGEEGDEPAQAAETPDEDTGGDREEPAPDIAGQAEGEAPAEPAPDEPAPEEAAPEDAKTGADETASGPDSTVGDLAQDVITKRLPAVTDPPDEEAPPGEGPSEPSGDAEAETGRQPALERFALDFDNPDDAPLMSIVLIDDGTSPLGPEALQGFPYALTIAVDADWSGAGEAASRYREAGFEVLAMVDLPQGARASDAETTMQAAFKAVPQAVGVMEGTETGLQTGREATEQLAPILLDTGHGLVLFGDGLNTAQKLIAREGVPAATVFRDFDANDQDESVIRRFLDQAAFKAGSEDNGVIMVGRLRPDTVSALVLWGLQDRASRVALAPVSALLRATAGQ